MGFMSFPQIALAAAQYLKTERPAEFGFAEDADIVIEELHEGSESRTFFQGVLHFENLRQTVTLNCNMFATF